MLPINQSDYPPQTDTTPTAKDKISPITPSVNYQISAETLKKISQNYSQESVYKLAFIDSLTQINTTCNHSYNHDSKKYQQEKDTIHLYQRLINNIPGMIYQFVLHPDGSQHFSYVSDGCRDIFGYGAEQILQNLNVIWDLILLSDRNSLETAIIESAKSLDRFLWEGRFLTSSGDIKWLQASAKPELQDNGDIVWDGLLTDISDRKRTEAEKDQFVSLIENSPDFIAIATLEGKAVFINQAGRRLVGLDSNTGVENIDIPAHHTFEDWEYIQKHVLPIVMETGKWEGEFRFRHFQTGAIIPIDYNIFTIKDSSGQPVALATITKDITYRKQAEEEKQTFVALAENNPDFVAIADLDGRGWYLNEAGFKLVGLSNMDEFLQTDISHYHTPEDWKIFQSQIAPTVMEKGRWQGELRFKHFKTGELIPIEYNIFLVKDPKTGHPTALATVTRDITERKLAEAAIKESEVRYKELAKREQIINRLASQIRQSLDLDTVLEIAIHEIRDLLQIDRCSFSWFQPQASPPIWETLKEAKLPHLPSLLGCHSIDKVGAVTELFLNQDILKIDDVSQLDEPIHRQFLESLGIKSEIVLPIKTPSRIGVIVCGHWQDIRHWTDSEVELLKAVVDQLAIAINQAELYTQSQQAAIVAQKQAEKIEQTLKQLQKTQSQLVQSEKMSSLGQLVAGVAHEINNPVNFIYGNLSHASTYAEEILKLIKLYRQEYTQATPEISRYIQEIDLDFIITDLPHVIDSMQVGAERIREIVHSLRTFSRLDEAEMKAVNIHEGIESTLLVLQHRLKTDKKLDINIIKNYGDFPKVICYAGQLNQVFMNLLANAIDALEEFYRQSKITNNNHIPTITISTTLLDSQSIRISIADNGPGIPLEIQKSLFDPFFTTKPVGLGTGLGLSISYEIVVNKHHGQISCISELGKGTEFIVEIPISQSDYS